ncbi:UNVERIFIED_CONTAM: hypothetical protein K2H54_066046 [Gekko kuhli]
MGKVHTNAHTHSEPGPRKANPNWEFPAEDFSAAQALQPRLRGRFYFPRGRIGCASYHAAGGYQAISLDSAGNEERLEGLRVRRIKTKIQVMKKTVIVEPVICLYMFAYSLYLPSAQQYVYRRIWEETVNSSFRDDDNVSHCALNQSDPTYLKEQEVQEKASLFAMKMDLSSAVLNILVAFVLVANGDRYGHKISLVLPVMGNLVSGIFLSAMSYYSLSLPFLYALAFISGLFGVFGGMSQFTLYELNDPLCWNEIYIGYGSAASTAISLTSFLGIVVLSRRLKDIYLVFIGIFSYLGGIIMAAFANTTLLMLLVRVPSLLVLMPLPVLRSMLSKVVLPSEQGALFACIACLEIVIGTISLAAFNSIYAVTVAWFPGFSFLLSAGLCIIPLGTMSWLVCATGHQQEYVPLVHEEEPAAEEADS